MAFVMDVGTESGRFSMTIYARTTTVYSIRDDEGNRDQSARRDIQNVLRWYPPCRDDDDSRAIKVLHDLDQGQPVSQDRMNYLSNYLARAIIYYLREEDEPYPGRNEEASRDMDSLLRCAQEVRL